MDSVDQSLQFIGETFIKARLGPIDAEVPISGTLNKARVLLEDGTGNADLDVSVCCQQEGMHGRPSSTLVQ